MDRKWWHNRIAYQIYPKSFIGNFRDGVLDFSIEKINYLIIIFKFKNIENLNNLL